MSCDPQYLAKVSLSLPFVFIFAELVCINYLITDHTIRVYYVYVQAGRERQRFDFDDFDTVPQKFNI